LRRRRTAGLLALSLTVGSGALWGCTDETPTSSDAELFPVEARSVEVRIPFSEFGSDLQVFSGFGSPVDLSQGLVAREFAGELDARTVARFLGFPRAVSVRDDDGTLVTDSSIAVIGGRVVAMMDTIRVPERPVTLQASALAAEAWDARSTTWQWAVDTVETRIPWSEPGAGPATFLDTGTWDPSESDTVVFAVDSATLAAWADTSDLSRGVRIETEEPGIRATVRNLRLDLDVASEINPDTTVVTQVPLRDLTFVFDPPATPPPDGMRVSGTPAWRTTFAIDLPQSLDGPPVLCEVLGCPFELTPGAVSFATLILRTRRSPPAYQPDDTLALDVRPVLLPERLPKSPLGQSLLGQTFSALLGRILPPAYFTTEPDQEIVVPVTRFVRDLVRGVRDDGTPAPSTIALLSAIEPVSISVASFHGAGTELQPILRIILSRDEGVRLP